MYPWARHEARGVRGSRDQGCCFTHPRSPCPHRLGHRVACPRDDQHRFPADRLRQVPRPRPGQHVLVATRLVVDPPCRWRADCCPGAGPVPEPVAACLAASASLDGPFYMAGMLIACAGATGLIATSSAPFQMRAAFAATALAWLDDGAGRFVLDPSRLGVVAPALDDPQLSRDPLTDHIPDTASSPDSDGTGAIAGDDRGDAMAELAAPISDLRGSASLGRVDARSIRTAWKQDHCNIARRR